MPDGLIEFDPLTGIGTVTRQDGSTYETDVQSFTEGALRVSGGFIIGATNFDRPIALGRTGNATLEQLVDGRYSLISQTQLSRLNQPFSGEAIRQVSADLTHTLADGTIQTYTLDASFVAGLGQRWIAESIGTDEWRYFTDKGDWRSNAEVNAAFGPQFRLADPLETAYASIMKSIIRNNQEQLNKIIDEEGLVSDDERSADYKAAAIVMQQLTLANLKAFSSYILEK